MTNEQNIVKEFIDATENLDIMGTESFARLEAVIRKAKMLNAEGSNYWNFSVGKGETVSNGKSKFPDYINVFFENKSDVVCALERLVGQLKLSNDELQSGTFFIYGKLGKSKDG